MQIFDSRNAALARTTIVVRASAALRLSKICIGGKAWGWSKI
jgi:hypothetical protein